MPDAFDGSLVQTLAKLFERGSNDGAGRRAALLPPPEMASGRMETGILDEHRDGTGNLYMAIAPLRRAAALAGRRAPVPVLPGEILATRPGRVERLARLAHVALA